MITRLSLASLLLLAVALDPSFAQADQPSPAAPSPAARRPSPPPPTTPAPPPGKAPQPTPGAALRPEPPSQDERCYQLSASATAWSRSPDLLCVANGATGDQLTVKLRAGFPPSSVTELSFKLASRARCIDCNKDIFELAAPDGSLFKQMKLVFNGRRNVKTGVETGRVTLFGRSLAYRLYGQPAPGPAVTPTAPVTR